MIRCERILPRQIFLLSLLPHNFPPLLLNNNNNNNDDDDNFNKEKTREREREYTKKDKQ